MYTRVTGDLGVECAREEVTLPEQHGSIVVREERLGAGPSPLDHGGTDQDGVDGVLAKHGMVPFEQRLETVNLPAVRIPANCDVAQPEGLLL